MGTVEVRLLGVSDLHGNLAGANLTYRDPYTGVTAPAGGAAVLAAHLRRRKAASPGPAFLVHAGDMVGGSPPESALLGEEPTVRVLDELGFDAGTPGNHELDRGVAAFFRLLRGEPGGFEGQGFPLVSANIVDAGTGQPVLPPFVLASAAGVPVAFVGATTVVTPSILPRAATAGLAFVDEAAAINRQAGVLARMGVNAVVALIHEGGAETDDPALALPRISGIAAALDHRVGVVLAGHTHTVLNTRVGGRLVLQPSAFGRAFADVTMTIDRRSGAIVASRAEIVPVWRNDPPGSTRPARQDPAVRALVDGAVATTGALAGRVVNVAARDLLAARDRGASPAGESPLGNLIADAQRSAMRAQFAFINPNSTRTRIAAGTVTWGALFAVQPFRNDLVRMELTGAQVWALLGQQFQATPVPFNRILEVSGLHYRYRSVAPGRGEILAVDEGPPGGASTPVLRDASRRYTVVVNAFLAAGGDNFTVLRDGSARALGPVDLDALVAHVEALPTPFDSRIERRITLEP